MYLWHVHAYSKELLVPTTNYCPYNTTSDYYVFLIYIVPISCKDRAFSGRFTVGNAFGDTFSNIKLSLKI